MTEFSGLKIPIVVSQSIVGLLHRHCEEAECDFECDRCLFHLGHLDEFEKWYKQKHEVKEGK